MSLYSKIFGVSPFAPGLLLLLETVANEIPRFRDAFVNEDKQIVIMTRTGGGNREEYEVENAALREIFGYLGDEDAGFDQTYAYFRYSPPERAANLIDEILEWQGSYDPDTRWAKFIADLKAGMDTLETRRGLELGKAIFAQIDRGDRIIEV